MNTFKKKILLLKATQKSTHQVRMKWMVIILDKGAKITKKQLSLPSETLAKFLVAILQWNGKSFTNIGNK